MGPAEETKRIDICGTFLTKMNESRMPGVQPTAVNVMRDLAELCQKFGLDVPPSVLSQCTELLLQKDATAR